MKECTSEYEELCNQRRVISERWTNARKLAKDLSLPQYERAKHSIRARELSTMYKNIDAQIKAIHHTDKYTKPKRKQRTSTGSHTNVGVMDLLLRNGALWSDLQANTWASYESLTWSLDTINGESLPNGRSVKRLLQLVRDGIDTCTEKQKELIIKYYTTDKNMTELAEEMGINKSAFSRTIHRGLSHVSCFVTAKLLIPRCIDEDHQFNYFLFLNSTSLLTERQKELVYLLLTDGGVSFREIAEYLKVNISTISRNAARIDYRLNSIAIELSSDLSNVHINRASWKGITEKTLAENMGLSRYFFYKTICRNETYQGIPAHHYFILQCYQNDVDTYPDDKIRIRYQRIATYAGCSRYSISYCRKKYREKVIDLSEKIEDYIPRPQKKIPPIKNFIQAISYSEKTAVLDLMSSETYLKLMDLAERVNHVDS